MAGHLPIVFPLERAVVQTLAAVTLVSLLPSASAQARASFAPNRPADSLYAAATACEVVQDLRPETERHGCVVEAFQETPTEYILRVRELAPPGARPLVFACSEVRLHKTDGSVIVKRVPEL